MNTHDELLIQDLKRQKPWVIAMYIITGILSIGIGFGFESPQSKLLCAGGGFLTALGIEKMVSRKIRRIALELWNQQQKN